ncbi:MAG: hypothetical protein IJ568_06930 [Bacilli bacterium]|nr:hypothetical protein [Bacilli bacterium]
MEEKDRIVEDKLNFDVKKMIQAFDFEEFLKARKKYNCAYLLITDSQLVMGYTRDFGKYEHVFSFASAINEIEDNPSFTNVGDLYYLNYITNKDYIKARFVHEGDNISFLAFDLSELKSISINQFQLFYSFYEKYNNMIEEYSKIYNSPLVMFQDKNQEEHLCSELSLLLDYLQSIIDYNKEIKIDKNIIGISIDDIKNNRRNK